MADGLSLLREYNLAPNIFPKQYIEIFKILEKESKLNYLSF